MSMIQENAGRRDDEDYQGKSLAEIVQELQDVVNWFYWEITATKTLKLKRKKETWKRKMKY